MDRRRRARRGSRGRLPRRAADRHGVLVRGGAPMNELIPSISIEALLPRRNAAAERVRGMLKAHLEIQELLEPIEHSSLGTTLYMSDRRAFDDADAAEQMIKGIDARMWDPLLNLPGLWQLMDATARRASRGTCPCAS